MFSRAPKLPFHILTDVIIQIAGQLCIKDRKKQKQQDEDAFHH